MLSKKSKIYLTGHTGLVGSAILRKLKILGYKNITTKTSSKLDLRNQAKVFNFFKKNKFEYVINAAGKVGGIHANDIYKANFIYDNLAIQNNIIQACYINKVKSLIFLGSSCVYPKNCEQPIREEYLLKSELEKTNEPYAIAKIAGIKMLESYNFQYGTNFKCLMPCNIYGPNDNYDLSTSHFFPALLKKAIIAKQKKMKKIILWGSGKMKRELMYVDDLANACIFFLDKKTKETLLNVGTSKEFKIVDYAKFIMKKLKLNCKIIFDKKKPDGTPRKILDCSKAYNYGWRPLISLDEGFDKTYTDYIANNEK